MYVPAHFEETRLDELHRIIGQYPLGVLVITGPNGLDANHVPFELAKASSWCPSNSDYVERSAT